LRFVAQAVVGTVVVVIDNFNGRDAAELQRKCTPEALHKAAGARLAASDVGYDVAPLLERKLEGDLRRVCNRVTGKYYMVVGPRGCGKTSTAVAAARGRGDGTTVKPSPGVLLLRANSREDTAKHILRALEPSDATKDAFAAMVKGADLGTLVPIFKAAIEAHSSQVAAEAAKGSEPASSPWVPTVIVDLDRNLKPDDVADVCRVAKLLACEMKIAAVVLVLSDAGAMGIPPDVARQAPALMSAAFV
jgi:hypothetical protein